MSLANGTTAHGEMAHLDPSRITLRRPLPPDDNDGGARDTTTRRWWWPRVEYAATSGARQWPILIHGNGPAGKQLLAEIAGALDAAGWPPPPSRR